MVDVTALEIASNDEAYAIAVQGSDTADFSTGSPKIEELAVLNLGAAEVIGGNQDSTTGRYELPFSNVKGGVAYGASDEWSWKAAQQATSTYDFHATVLHLLGIDHEKLTFRHDGADRRLTDVHGEVIHDVLA